MSAFWGGVLIGAGGIALIVAVAISALARAVVDSFKKAIFR